MNQKLIKYLKENPVDLTADFKIEEYDPYDVNLEELIKFDYSNETLTIDESAIDNIYEKISNNLIEDFHYYDIDNYLNNAISELKIEEDITIDDYKNFVEINVDEDSILKEYKVIVDILIDHENLNTEGSNLAYSIETIADYLNDKSSDLKEIDPITKMLFKSQGYRIENLKHPTDGFLQSFIEEIDNSGFYTPLVYTFVREMSLKDLKDLLKKESIEILPGEPFGLFGPTNGSGSLMEISLERTFNIPLSYVYLSNTYNSSYGYSTSSVYGGCLI